MVASFEDLRRPCAWLEDRLRVVGWRRVEPRPEMARQSISGHSDSSIAIHTPSIREWPFAAPRVALSHAAWE